jgi:hypothetical protein
VQQSAVVALQQNALGDPLERLLRGFWEALDQTANDKRASKANEQTRAVKQPIRLDANKTKECTCTLKDNMQSLQWFGGCIPATKSDIILLHRPAGATLIALGGIFWGSIFG